MTSTEFSTGPALSTQGVSVMSRSDIWGSRTVIKSVCDYGTTESFLGRSNLRHMSVLRLRLAICQFNNGITYSPGSRLGHDRMPLGTPDGSRQNCDL